MREPKLLKLLFRKSFIRWCGTVEVADATMIEPESWKSALVRLSTRFPIDVPWGLT